MKHSRKLVRLAITFALILIGSLNLPGAGRRAKASASAAHGAPSTSSVAAQGPNISSSLRVGQNADGRLELFEEGTDGAIWHNWQVEPSGSVWSGWNTLGQPSKGHVIAPIMGRNADGRLEVFALGPDCELWHIWQVTPGGSWSGWASLGGNVCFVGFPGSVEMNADGRLEVFSGTSSGMGINHKWQVTRGGSWSGWALLPGEDLSDPTAARNADGRLEVFAEGPGDGVSHNWQVKPGGSWSGWYTL
jgi:hypothetical protein